jgi:hypothetical protein
MSFPKGSILYKHKHNKHNGGIFIYFLASIHCYDDKLVLILLLLK